MHDAMAALAEWAQVALSLGGYAFALHNEVCLCGCYDVRRRAVHAKTCNGTGNTFIEDKEACARVYIHVDRCIQGRGWVPCTA